MNLIFQHCFTFVIWLGVTLSSSKPVTRHVQTEWAQYIDRGTKGPGSYIFGYDIEDAGTNNVQFRHEQYNGNGTVVGSYGLLEPDGNLRIIHYIADQLGYRAQIENTKKKNEAHPNTDFYKDLEDNFNSGLKTKPRLDLTTKSPYLQSAQQNLPLLGTNFLHEERIPPVHQKTSQQTLRYNPSAGMNVVSRLYGNEQYYTF